jgi:chorismate mutase/prephenate dehydratase
MVPLVSDPKDDFARIRASLESADAALLEALDHRAQAMQEYRALRERDPEGYYALPRDAELLARARESVKSFPSASVEPVLREVLSASHHIVAPITVAYLGPEGAFAHTAARKRFGAAAELRVRDTVDEVLEEVERGRASHAVVPLETSSDGALTATLHGLVKADVRISGELTVPASYHLMSSTGNAQDVEKIYGAPHAIAMCEKHLRTQFPRATVLDVPSGEVAAQFAKEDHGAAAVGTEIIAERYDLRVVRERIEDTSGIETRFAVVGHEHPPRTGRDKTVLALATHDEPGALYRALHPFAERDINLTRLESRPVRGQAWRYVFFVELDGHVTDRPVLTALEELRGTTRFVKILGSYPRPA